MAKRKSKSDLELQVEALRRTAQVFEDEAERLARSGVKPAGVPVGPAAEAAAVASGEAPIADESREGEPSDATDEVTDDIAGSLEWVDPTWAARLTKFLDDRIGSGAGARFFELYEAHNYNYAVEILTTSHSAEFEELAKALLGFRIKTEWIMAPGGNQSPVPQVLQQALYPLDWHETRLKGHMVFEQHVTQKTQRLKNKVPVLNKFGFAAYDKKTEVKPKLRMLVVDAHMIDHIKGAVAFDMEWNSKDQTFDRDLYAMRLFHEAHLIAAGVLLTRSKELNPVFKQLEPIAPSSEKLSQKYGASTTWMGKLLYRLRSSRSGGCPVLALGIRKACISDLSEFLEAHGVKSHA